MSYFIIISLLNIQYCPVEVSVLDTYIHEVKMRGVDQPTDKKYTLFIMQDHSNMGGELYNIFQFIMGISQTFSIRQHIVS